MSYLWVTSELPLSYLWVTSELPLSQLWFTSELPHSYLWVTSELLLIQVTLYYLSLASQLNTIKCDILQLSNTVSLLGKERVGGSSSNVILLSFLCGHNPFGSSRERMVDRRKIGKDFQVAWIFLLVLQMSFVSLVERDRQIEKP